MYYATYIAVQNLGRNSNTTLHDHSIRPRCLDPNVLIVSHLHRSQAETVRRQTGEAAVDSTADAGSTAGSGATLPPPPVAAAADTAADERRPSQRLHNQFNFTERAVQTASYPPRERGTSSEPPPTASASGSQRTRTSDPKPCVGTDLEPDIEQRKDAAPTSCIAGQ